MNLNHHIILSRYFVHKSLYLDEPTQKKPNIRKLVEQPWQQTKGETWDEVTETLCNLDFIQAKANSKMTNETWKELLTKQIMAASLFGKARVLRAMGQGKKSISDVF
jgi:hypothetical protein